MQDIPFYGPTFAHRTVNTTCASCSGWDWPDKGDLELLGFFSDWNLAPKQLSRLISIWCLTLPARDKERSWGCSLINSCWATAKCRPLNSRAVAFVWRLALNDELKENKVYFVLCLTPNKPLTYVVCPAAEEVVEKMQKHSEPLIWGWLRVTTALWQER